MGSTSSVPVSNSHIVFTNTIICKYGKCIYKVGKGKTYCTIHDNAQSKATAPKPVSCSICFALY
jgi:hypothetical protein